MKTCITCGMPFEGNHVNDIALELPEGPVCKFDSENDKLKSPEDIFKGGIEFFTTAATDGDQELGARLTRRNMRTLPYWQAHPFEELSGPEATDKEFEEAMTKI